MEIKVMLLKNWLSMCILVASRGTDCFTLSFSPSFSFSSLSFLSRVSLSSQSRQLSFPHLSSLHNKCCDSGYCFNFFPGLRLARFFIFSASHPLNFAFTDSFSLSPFFILSCREEGGREKRERKRLTVSHHLI